MFLYKYLCNCINKSAFNWTFCQLLTEKTQFHKNVYYCKTRQLTMLHLCDSKKILCSFKFDGNITKYLEILNCDIVYCEELWISQKKVCCACKLQVKLGIPFRLNAFIHLIRFVENVCEMYSYHLMSPSVPRLFVNNTVNFMIASSLHFPLSPSRNLNEPSCKSSSHTSDSKCPLSPKH